MSPPGRPGEPQSARDEQGRQSEEQVFPFHCFLFFDSGSKFVFAGIVRGFPGIGFRFGTKAEDSGAKGQRAGMKLIPRRVITRL
jgi:hypothetical protein